ncbi:MAG TPA: DNA replication/repair protein RecF [Bacteroidales bacterium]|nr:DNA replication/repair protein RecF [Bacteroidales bacterium]
MYLSKILLTNFKNYDGAELIFSPRINCFVGDNGVGKTNILDSIHYLSLTKSYFTNVDLNNIKHGEDYFIVKGEFRNGNDKNEVYCGFQREKRKALKLNGKEYDKLSDHIGRFPVVMISPADNSIISEGSDVRRKFMNNVISQYDRGYLEEVIRYNKALKNRNRLLKDYGRAGTSDREMLSLWEHHMIPAAGKIYREREAFIKEIIPVFQEYYNHVSGQREEVELVYRSQLEGQEMNRLFDESYEKDRIMQYTTAGIHKDDLLLMMDSYAIKDLGSQGQQKSYLVALKLAKFEYITKKGGKKPVLLMDDIFDKFDEKRVKQIIKLVSDNKFGQIFITDTHQERLVSILEGVNIEYKLFRINKGVEEVISNGDAS